MTSPPQTTITKITVDEDYQSIFTEEEHPLTARGDLWISEQQEAVNFRYRQSPAHYESDWHVAGDPTLIIVCGGEMEITLQNGEKKSFKAGECFIAADYLPSSVSLDPARHGHRAKVVGPAPFSALHIKLEKRGNSE